MEIQREFDFGESQETVATNSGIERISQMIADFEVPICDISRSIALEIFGIIRQMTEDVPRQRGVSQRDLNDRVKALRELQKSLTEGDALSKRDILNLDGPKFTYAFTEIIGWFKKALRDAGVEEPMTQNIMLQFGDLVKANDESLRRELNGH